MHGSIFPGATRLHSSLWTHKEQMWVSFPHFLSVSRALWEGGAEAAPQIS